MWCHNWLFSLCCGIFQHLICRSGFTNLWIRMCNLSVLPGKRFSCNYLQPVEDHRVFSGWVCFVCPNWGSALPSILLSAKWQVECVGSLISTRNFSEKFLCIRENVTLVHCFCMLPGSELNYISQFFFFLASCIVLSTLRYSPEKSVPMF